MKKLTSAKLIINAPAGSEDIIYATGFTPVDPVVCIKHEKKTFLVVPALELGRAGKEAPSTVVYTPNELPLSSKEMMTIKGWALGLLKILNIQSIVVHESFPIGIATYLKQKRISVTVTDKPLFPQRAVKCKEEIKHITAAQKAAVAAMKSAIRCIRNARVSPGQKLKFENHILTSDMVREHIDIELLKHDCISTGTIVACGKQSADPHEKGYGPLVAGQPIVIDIFPRNRTTGYWGDITRTICKGIPSAEIKAMHQIVKHAQQNAIKMVKHGVMANAVHQTVSLYFEQKGYSTDIQNGIAEGFIHSTGHGVGLDIHEAPSVGRRKVILKKGNVITIEPGLYYSDIGGVRIEDTVVVTQDGCRILANCAKTMKV